MWCDKGETVVVEPVSDYTCLHAFKVRYQLTSQNKPVTERKLKQEILLEQVMIIIHQQHNEIALKYVISFPFLEKIEKGKKRQRLWEEYISTLPVLADVKTFCYSTTHFVICTKHFFIQPLILYFAHQEGIVFALE